METDILKRNLSTLQLLSIASKKQREALIATWTRDQIMCLWTIKLTDVEISALNRFMWLIQFLAKTRNNRRDPEKRQYINYFWNLLPIIINATLHSYINVIWNYKMFLMDIKDLEPNTNDRLFLAFLQFHIVSVCITRIYCALSVTCSLDLFCVFTLLCFYMFLLTTVYSKLFEKLCQHENHRSEIFLNNE